MCSAHLQAGAAGGARALRDVGRATGLAAAVVAAGVATSALAIDVDLAVAGALVAAGAMLQGGDRADAKGAHPPRRPGRVCPASSPLETGCGVDLGVGGLTPRVPEGWSGRGCPASSQLNRLPDSVLTNLLPVATAHSCTLGLEVNCGRPPPGH